MILELLTPSTWPDDTGAAAPAAAASRTKDAPAILEGGKTAVTELNFTSVQLKVVDGNSK